MSFNFKDNTTTILNDELSGSNQQWSHVELYFRHRLYKIPKEKVPFSMGRDGDCNLQVYSDVASRHHCTVDVHDGQIGIKDSSTNGTFIEFGRADEVMVRNEFCPLTGQGRICLGDRIDADDPNLILFKVIRSA
ncbi:MAG: FHA domain-containing protein [Cellvibrionaceae bacterium]|nr:FHA domain-containing protein [Cellvibrionaceae bacterium]